MRRLEVPPGIFPPPIEADLRGPAGRIAALLGEVERVVVGWATVDLDRAVAALDRPALPAADDELLGARCVTVEGVHPEPALVLLEPSTEGRLAASLARHGEGPIALYAVVTPHVLDALRVVVAAGGVHLSRLARGPLGESVLVADAPPSGPHLLVAADTPRVTIER
jgi:hypothetical protein